MLWLPLQQKMRGQNRRAPSRPRPEIHPWSPLHEEPGSAETVSIHHACHARLTESANAQRDLSACHPGRAVNLIQREERPRIHV